MKPLDPPAQGLPDFVVGVAAFARRTCLAMIALTALLALGACGESVGTRCEISGSGFHANDPCRHKCLSRWSLLCPDETRVRPNVCSGGFACTPGSCPSGQLCYHDDDPFDDRSFCIPSNVCGTLSPAAGADWERATLARQRAVIKQRQDTAMRRSGAAGLTVAAPAESVDSNADMSAVPTPSAPLNRAQPLPCTASDQRDAVLIEANERESGAPVLIAADQRFERTVQHDWRFVLAPTAHGFAIKLLDQPRADGAFDLASVTPPLRGPANPRDIAGWHFRNAANTGPNEGDVNAPQHLRLFQFEPSLTGAAAGTALAAHVEGATGRGWLRIENLQLTPPIKDVKASIEQMAFRACLTWPRPSKGEVVRWQRARETRQAEANAARIDYDDAERELFGACGLSLVDYELKAQITPRVLTLDIDGDGSTDQVAQIVRRRDGQRALALCRAGTWLTLIDSSHVLAQSEAVRSTIASLEAWQVDSGNRGAFGFVDEPAWPQTSGQVVVLERIEKSLIAFYWHNDRLSAHIGFRNVEP